MPDGVLPALGRFAPGSVFTRGDTQQEITIITNLAGEPIRFSLHEDIANVLSSASLVLLNAEFDEFNETDPGVYSSDAEAEIVEEDEALWNTVYSGATVEPNQMVRVTEIIGSYTSSVVDGITQYTADEGSDVCTTYWRVVTFTVYEDEEGIPYCDIQLESIVSYLINKTCKTIIDDLVATNPPVDESGEPRFIMTSPTGETTVIPVSDPNCATTVLNLQGQGYTAQYTKAGEDPIVVDAFIIVDQAYWDGVSNDYDRNKNIDGYAYKSEAEAILGQNKIIKVATPDEWIAIFMDTIMDASITVESGSIAPSGEISGLTFMPCKKVYQAGDEIWKCIEEMLAFNLTLARFKRNLELVQWTTEDEGWGTETDIGAYGTGIKGTYTKENTYSDVDVTGYVGKRQDNGLWYPWDKGEKKVSCHLNLSDSVLNGERKQMPDITIEGDYLLQSVDQVKAWGIKELYKSFLQARGIAVDSDALPLSLEVGMKITGTSSLFGTVSILVTTLDRTTDAQQNTTTTSITGRGYGAGETGITGDTWV